MKDLKQEKYFEIFERPLIKFGIKTVFTNYRVVLNVHREKILN